MSKKKKKLADADFFFQVLSYYTQRLHLHCNFSVGSRKKERKRNSNFF